MSTRNPTAIILNIPCRINFDALVESGLSPRPRSLAEEQIIMEKQQALAPDVNPYRFNGGKGRIDAAGTLRGDMGTPVLESWEGSTHEAITLKEIIADIVAAGYSLVDVNLVPREGKQPSLFLRFEKNPSRYYAPSMKLMDQLTLLLNRMYRKVTIWDNESTKGTLTINPSAGLLDGEVAKLTDPRILRMSEDLDFINVKLNRSQPTVKRAPDAFDRAAPVVEEPRRERRERRVTPYEI